MTCPEITAVVNNIKEHYLIWMGAAGYVVSAMIDNLPKPGTEKKFYDFFYGTLQQLNTIPAMQKFEQKEHKIENS